MTSEASWPVDELQAVPACPSCGATGDVSPLYEALTDRVFGLSPGTWNMRRCRACGSGWLDPRPSDSSLGRAYEGYFTHEKGVDAKVVRRKGVLRAFLHDAINDYVNHRYGTSLRPAVPFGRFLVRLLPPLRAAVDALYRDMPRGAGGRLLDVGCGNGMFLRLARAAGWDAMGLDLDTRAAEVARAEGFDIRVGPIDVMANQAGGFDMVTSSHVLEHVHDPRAHLAALHALLKPNGRLWIEVPNLDSLGHRLFQRDWRDLDPPRHLWLPSRDRMLAMLREAGFRDIEVGWSASSVFDVFRASRAIRSGRRAVDATLTKRHFPLDIVAMLVEWASPRHREFITLSARRSS